MRIEGAAQPHWSEALSDALERWKSGPLSQLPAVAAVAAIFYLLMEWSFTPLAEFDAYYHVGITEVFRDQGLVRTFPWMSTSILRDHFHDPQLLLHLLMLPLLWLHLEPMTAGKLVAALTAAGFATTFYWFLVKQSVRFPVVWTLILLVASPYFIARLTFIKTTALFLSLLLGFLNALFEGRKLQLFVFSWLAALTYQGFPLFLVVAVLYLGIRAMLGEGMHFKESLSPIVLGMFMGLVVSPFFPNNLRFLHFELVQQILLKPKELALGAEWEPVSSSRFFGSAAFAILCLFGSEVFASVARAKSDARLVLIRGLAVLLMLGALQSARLIDYFVPLSVLAAAMTVSRGFAELGDERFGFRVAAGISMFLCLPVAALHVKEALRITGSISQELTIGEYERATNWLKAHSQAGDVVVSQWDDFPMLFYFDRKNRYLWGLNVAYGYGYDPRIYTVVSLLFEGRVRDPESFLPQVNAKYLLVARSSSYPGRRALVEMLKQNPWFDEVMTAGSLHLYQRREQPKVPLGLQTPGSGAAQLGVNLPSPGQFVASTALSAAPSVAVPVASVRTSFEVPRP
jgi:hypothetical protein